MRVENFYSIIYPHHTIDSFTSDKQKATCANVTRDSSVEGLYVLDDIRVDRPFSYIRNFFSAILVW